MKIGMLIPTYANEKRVALLPEDIHQFDNELVVERGFGQSMDIPDEAYEKKGCVLADRETIFKECDVLFSLKLLQPSDYPFLREGQMVLGWTHPEESGKPFMDAVGNEKELIIVDLDNITPSLHIQDRKIQIPWIPRDFVSRNSFMAGYAAVMHAFISFGKMPDTETNIAVLAPGNVSQGAYAAAVRLGAHNIRLFYRKTMGEFMDALEEFDVIISGIELLDKSTHILTLDDQKRLKPGMMIIDAAADAGYTIAGTRYTEMDDPLYKENGIYYYCVNNAPSVLYREASKEISRSFSKWVYSKNVSVFYELAEQLKETE